MELRSKEPFEIRNGRIIYLEHCAPCHGVTGKGNGNYYASGLEPRPRNFTDPEFMKQIQDDYLFDVITKGTAAFGMSPFCPPWGETLGEEEKIKNIISFLRTLVSKK
jgi:mono/diheme cytochrome c family protein